eukprot:TRINITY_DN3236_c0_g1_i1.p1 TRINITY_DN3236_c0_g1~~TRINITY_DN3236_c0_g1_i1.p1  ORF type:complete len:185 (+),score=52.53 TRINITY_DN3236_c0_g1_i1:684-1238(+)
MLAQEGRMEMIQLLLKYNPIIDSPNNEGATPLIIACKGGHCDVINLLLDQGADIESMDCKGNTPLITACTGGHAEVVRRLLERGADVERTMDQAHTTALMHACQYGHIEVVKILVDHGANVETQIGDMTARLMTFGSPNSNAEEILKILGPLTPAETNLRLLRWKLRSNPESLEKRKRSVRKKR